MIFDSTSVICVSRFNYKTEPHVQRHSHNFYHFFYIVGGAGSIIMESEVNEVAENDIFICSLDMDHEIISSVTDPMKTIELKFVTEDARLVTGISQLPYRINNKSPKIKIMFNNLLEEALVKKPFYSEIITVNIFELLLQLFRIYGYCTYLNNEPALKLMIDESDTRSELASRLHRYINQHFTEKITLESISQTFNTNKDYLCRMFSKAFGISPIQYVIQLRMERAKVLLVDTELSITEISESVGFNSIHYLSRYLRKRRHVSDRIPPALQGQLQHLRRRKAQNRQLQNLKTAINRAVFTPLRQKSILYKNASSLFKAAPKGTG